MRIFITGATGFIGRALVLRLRREGHQPVAWVRDLRRGRSLLGQEAELVAASGGDAALDVALASCEGVVNLAGENVLKGRWTRRRRRLLQDSRVARTEHLVAAMGRLPAPPRVLVSASAIGYYGDAGGAPRTEDASPGSDFLAQLCVAWEGAAMAATALGVRVTCPRIGVVLGHEGGMLDQLLPLFASGLGGPIGDGRQILSWIHLHDLVDSIVQALTDVRFVGPYNAVAPNPVDNATFTRLLAVALGQRARLRVPRLALRLMLGRAAEVVLASVQALPERLTTWQFACSHPELGGALAALLDASCVQLTVRGAISPQPLDDGYVTRWRPDLLLRSETRLRQTRPEVFDFFCRAENLGLMTPAPMAMQILGNVPEPMRAEVEICYALRLGPLPMRWRTRIARWQAPSLFVDAQMAGPYRAWWHEHAFHVDGSGTRMEDRVYYRIPFGPLGRLVHRFFIRQQLQRIFWYRASAIKLRFG